MLKPKIAILGLTSCEGCQVVILDQGEKFLDFLSQVEVSHFRLIEEEEEERDITYDVVFVEGNPITKENLRSLEEARKRSKILVALGNCAALGGVTEIKNYRGKEKMLRYVYKRVQDIVNPDIKPIGEFVKVDFVVPGCPIDGEDFLKTAAVLITGKIPETKEKPICLECSRRGKDCFLSQREICFGPITRGGCGSICTSGALPCYGCRGVFRGAVVRGLLENFKKNHPQKEIEEDLEIFGIKDDVEKLLI